MKTNIKKVQFTAIMLTVGILAASGYGAINSVKGPTFNLTAKEGYVQTPDGGSYYMFGYAHNNGLMQYPGPTLDVNQGATVTINLTNQLDVPVSIVFPGQSAVSASGDANGLLTKEAAANGGTAQYSFVASKPGTYMYYSGTNPELQVEMGLVGALIVRPTGIMGSHMAYDSMDSMYDDEFLFLLTEMDPKIHECAQMGKWNRIDLTTYWPVLWFINGRCAPDTMLEPNIPILPNQPYNCMPIMHPGEKILLRFIGGGRDMHPFHLHGNNFTQIAKDGRLLSSAPGRGADLAVSDFTLTVAPGETVDTIFTWTGEKLGWDIYGHDPNDPLEPHEYAPDHGKPFPVVLPDIKDLTFGMHYSGSPFLGAMGALPPGEGGFNMNGGYMYMWHSHNEKEMVNYDIFPGGMMTMLIIDPNGTGMMH
ncbi:MAG: multicopper oxidase domain-containing protein [Phycisphaerae bacterium]|nr:multicopper oxidase domain-containing protein [Phycisphaerae bacterium]